MSPSMEDGVHAALATLLDQLDNFLLAKVELQKTLQPGSTAGWFIPHQIAHLLIAVHDEPRHCTETQ